MGIRIELPTSTSIAAVTYDAATHTLGIEFRREHSYRYFMVPQDVFDQLLAAASAGDYFREYIRNRYPAEKVD